MGGQPSEPVRPSSPAESHEHAYGTLKMETIFEQPRILFCSPRESQHKPSCCPGTGPVLREAKKRPGERGPVGTGPLSCYRGPFSTFSRSRYSSSAISPRA